MKNMLNASNGTHFTARVLRSTAVLLTGVALGFTLWTATAPLSLAQDMSPSRMIEESLPGGRTMANASKPQFLAAVCSAVKKFRNAAPQITRAAIDAKGPWRNDIIRTVVRCLGSRDCALLGQVLNALNSASPDDASATTELFMELAPACAGSFGQQGGDDEGNYGNAPGNQNPPPGSIGGGGGQGNVIAICHNGRTIFVSPRGAENHLRNHAGDTLGPCPVTPNQNP
jgi:hypothetical protein